MRKYAGYFLLIILLLGLIVAIGRLSDFFHQDLKVRDTKIRNLEEIKQQQEDSFKKLQEKYNKLKLSKASSAEKQVAAKPTPTPQIIQAAGLSNPQIMKIVYATFGNDPRLATLIQCESGFNPQAVGYDSSYNQYNYGLFQVSQYHGWSYDYLIVPVNNVKAAKIIYDRQGWGAWPVCSRRAGLL